MTKTVHGRLCGKTIELDEDLGIRDGRVVEVEVRVIDASASAKAHRRLGTMKGSVTYMAPDFDAPLDEFQEFMS